MGDLRKVVGPRPLFNVGVSVVLQDDQGRWLLQRRSDSGLWGLPGGGLEPGETFLEAARRELEEETGLKDVPLTPMMSLSGPELYHRYPHGDEVYLVGQAVRAVLGAARFAEATLGTDGETLELRLFGLDQLPVLSGGAEHLVARRLRQEAGLPELPALTNREDQHPPRPSGGHLAELRALMGPRPLFAPGAAVLVRNPAGQLLMMQQPDSGLWTLPGGVLELGETLEEGARRTLLRQTGLDAAQLEELDFFAGARYRLTTPGGEVTDPVWMLYRAHGVVSRQPVEGDWFDLHRLPPLAGPLVQAMLDRASRL